MKLAVRAFVVLVVAIGIGTFPAAAHAFDRIAHRGYGDSTAAQYQAAGQTGAALEADMQQTKDNLVVISHDARLQGRCAGKLISSLHWAQVHACNAKIITLDGLLRIAKQNRVKVWIEFKDNGGKNWTTSQMRVVAKRLSYYGMLSSRTEVYSFNPTLIRQWRTVTTATKTGLNVNKTSKLTVSAIKKAGGRVAVRMDLVTPTKVRTLQRSGVYVAVYTARNQSEMARAKSLGPNAIVSDIRF